MRLDPWLPEHQVCLAPALPRWLNRLQVEGIPLGGLRLGVTVENGTTTVTGLAEGVTLDRQPRSALTSLLLPGQK